MSDLKSYAGGCHCGAVRYRVEADLSKVMRCDCSRCAKLGIWLSFVPATQFQLESGEDVLTDYLFNKKTIHHLFCSRCGIESFARATGPDGVPTVALNVRCLDGVDLEAISPVLVHGKDR